MATNGGSTTNVPVSPAGDAYGQLIEEQLQEERNRKSSVEQRGIAVITTSGVLVSLLFGLAAVVTASTRFVLPGAARVFLLLSLPCFLAAAVLGIRANLPMKYQEAGPEGLRRILEPQFWNGPAAVGTLRVAEVRVDILTSYRQQTTVKAKALVRAMWAEVAGVCLVALAVGVILVAHGDPAPARGSAAGAIGEMSSGSLSLSTSD